MKRPVKIPGWLITIFAAISGWLVTWLSGMGLDSLASRMFLIWGVTGKNIQRAPEWIRLIADNYALIKGSVQALVLLIPVFLFARLIKMPGPKWGRGSFTGAILGLGTGALTVAALLILDGMRFGGFERISAGAAFSLVMYASSACGLSLLFAWLIPVALSGGKYNCDIWLTAIICALLTAPAYTPATLLNTALIAAISALLARMKSGVGASCLYRFGLYAFIFAVMGCPGGAGGIFECYPAHYDWLSGEYLGPLDGFMLTVALLASLAIILKSLAGGNDGRIDSDKRK